jgi:hypothetical protein
MGQENALVEEDELPGRKEKRYPANAQVAMKGSRLLLKDVSLSGGRIQSEDFIDIVPNGNYTIAIIPEEESQINGFEVEILSRWVRMNKNGSETGFIMVLPPGNKMVEDYIAFLRSRISKQS